jgi:hypothetical protein
MFNENNRIQISNPKKPAKGFESDIVKTPGLAY